MAIFKAMHKLVQYATRAFSSNYEEHKLADVPRSRETNQAEHGPRIDVLEDRCGMKPLAETSLLPSFKTKDAQQLDTDFSNWNTEVTIPSTPPLSTTTGLDDNIHDSGYRSLVSSAAKPTPCEKLYTGVRDDDEDDDENTAVMEDRLDFEDWTPPALKHRKQKLRSGRRYLKQKLGLDLQTELMAANDDDDESHDFREIRSDDKVREPLTRQQQPLLRKSAEDLSWCDKASPFVPGVVRSHEGNVAVHPQQQHQSQQKFQLLKHPHQHPQQSQHCLRPHDARSFVHLPLRTTTTTVVPLPHPRSYLNPLLECSPLAFTNPKNGIDAPTVVRQVPCLQCVLKKLPCDMKVPHCTRCRRNLPSQGPCLVQRELCPAERSRIGLWYPKPVAQGEDVAESGGVDECGYAVLVRLRGFNEDDDEMWAEKKALEEQLLTYLGEQIDRENWVLPINDGMRALCSLRAVSSSQAPGKCGIGSAGSNRGQGQLMTREFRFLTSPALKRKMLQLDLRRGDGPGMYRDSWWRGGDAVVRPPQLRSRYARSGVLAGGRVDWGLRLPVCHTVRN